MIISCLNWKSLPECNEVLKANAHQDAGEQTSSTAQSSLAEEEFKRQ